MADREPLFSPSLLSKEVVSSLPAGFSIRPLRREDFKKGYLDCLRVLTWVGDLTEEEWNSRFDEMARATGTYYLLALEHENRVVGTGSLVVERKLYVSCPRLPCPTHLSMELPPDAESSYQNS